MTQRRNRLSAEQIIQIIDEWDQKSYEDFASEFGVVVNTIRSAVTDIRKEDDTKCPRKARKTRRDLVREALQIIRDREQDTLTG
jgi:transposase